MRLKTGILSARFIVVTNWFDLYLLWSIFNCSISIFLKLGFKPLCVMHHVHWCFNNQMKSKTQFYDKIQHKYHHFMMSFINFLGKVQNYDFVHVPSSHNVPHDLKVPSALFILDLNTKRPLIRHHINRPHTVSMSSHYHHHHDHCTFMPSISPLSQHGRTKRSE